MDFNSSFLRFFLCPARAGSNPTCRRHIQQKFGNYIINYISSINELSALRFIQYFKFRLPLYYVSQTVHMTINANGTTISDIDNSSIDYNRWLFFKNNARQA